MRLNSQADFLQYKDNCSRLLDLQKKKILVCGGSGCLAGGSMKIYEKFKALLAEKGLDFDVELKEHVEHPELYGVKLSGCHGFCELGPLVRIEPEGILYTKCKESDCEEIIEQTILRNEVIDRLLFHENGRAFKIRDDIPFFRQQTNVVLRQCGLYDAGSIEEYIALGGYSALIKALFDMDAEGIIAEVSRSGLRGRGGAGFPTGKKWAAVAAHKDAATKYVICNGDEGDPGAFIDCSVMEGMPHRVLEGMIISAIACGADEGRIYVRAEYPLAVSRMEKAISDAEELGLIGENILSSGKSFKLRLCIGAGAFVCGESTALIEAVEGRRGMPRTRPPRTSDIGLYSAPTSVNNVETLANIPAIINEGAAWFSSIGAPNNSGTKAFSLTGNIKHTGIIEVPFGTTLREIIFNIGGGVKTGNFKAVQIGGPSGCCLTEEHLDLPLDFDSARKIDAIIGSGGIVVLGDDTCMVELARFFMSFARNESCGKCTACRDGIPKIQDILEQITHGHGEPQDLDMLQELSSTVKACSLCGLGKTATNPVLSTLKFFKSEYIAHVKDKRCPAGVCRSLCKLWIDPSMCIGCTKCARNCPTGAITGMLRKPHVIDVDKCIKCRVCKTECPKHAIKEV